MAVGEFSGDDTEGECVLRLGPRLVGDLGPRAMGTETVFGKLPFPALSL